MSSSKRLDLFRDAVVTKNLSLAKNPSYGASYRRLFLTRRAAEFILSAIIIFNGYQLIIVNTFFSPVWLFAGVALSALFLRGNTMLSGIFIGTLSCCLFYDYSPLLSFSQALVFTLTMYLTREASLKLIGPVAPLATLSVLWKFIAICGFFCACHVLIIKILFANSIKINVSGFDWAVAFLGELNGILCLTPLCLVFTPFVPKTYLKEKSKLWLWVGILIMISHFGFFFLKTGTPSFTLAIVLGLFISGYAAFFGLVPLSVTLFGISIIYLAGALPHAHLFHQQSSHGQTLILLIIFTLTCVVSLSIGTRKQRYYFVNKKTEHL